MVIETRLSSVDCDKWRAVVEMSERSFYEVLIKNFRRPYYIKVSIRGNSSTNN